MGSLALKIELFAPTQRVHEISKDTKESVKNKDSSLSSFIFELTKVFTIL